MLDPAKNIWLSGNVPSSKNSKRVVRAGGGKLRVIWSELADKYRKSVRYEMQAELPHWKELTDHLQRPLMVGFHFVRSSKRLFDFHNAVQTIADLMVTNKWIEDDHMGLFIPIPLQIESRWLTIDPESPGVIIQPDDAIMF